MQTQQTLENSIYNRNCAPARIPKPKYYIKDQTNIDSKNFPQGNCYSLILNRMFAQLIKFCCALSKIPGSPCQAELHGPPSYHCLQSRIGIPLRLAPHLAASAISKSYTFYAWTKENGPSVPEIPFAYPRRYAVSLPPISSQAVSVTTC